MADVKISKIVLKGRKYKVYTNIDYVIFTEDIIVKYKVLKDRTFSLEQWEHIKNSNEESLLFDKVLNFIDFKPRTKKEVEIYLNNNLVDINKLDNIIEELIKMKYIDDDRYAENYILECIRKHIGPILIQNKLEMLGITKDIYSKYFGKYDKVIEYENAETIANNYLKQISKYPQLKQKQLLYNKLLRSGYGYDICNKILNTLKLNNEIIE